MIFLLYKTVPNAPQINNIRESYDFRTNQRTQVYVEFAHEVS